MKPVVSHHVVKQRPLRSCPTAPCPRCGQSVRGVLGAINRCRCGALLRRYDTGEWGVVADEKGQQCANTALYVKKSEAGTSAASAAIIRKKAHLLHRLVRQTNGV